MSTKGGRKFGISLLLAGFAIIILGLKGYYYIISTIEVDNIPIGIDNNIIGIISMLVGMICIR